MEAWKHLLYVGGWGELGTQGRAEEGEESRWGGKLDASFMYFPYSQEAFFFNLKTKGNKTFNMPVT